MKKFKPLKAPNEETNLDIISYPVLVSYKLDGLRCLFKEGQMLTCSLKKFPNKQVNEKFELLRKFSEDNNLILDGEFYTHGVPFQMIVSCAMTHDYNTKQSIKNWEKLCKEHSFYVSREEVLNKIKFNGFDRLGNVGQEEWFELRLDYTESILALFQDLATVVIHKWCNNKEEVEALFEEALNDKYEGLMLRNPKGKYKFGRATLNENIIYKVKPWVTLDAKIKGIIQATEVNENTEREINELGYSKTSKKKDDRHLIEKASAFLVNYEGKDLKVTLSMTDQEKEYVWNYQEEFIGKWVEFKYLKIGMKEDGLPRHPTTVRMRLDK